jgi:hypothetical protein
VGGAISATLLSAGFGRHPGFNTWNANPLYSCFYIKNTNGTARTYANIVISPSRVGTAKSTITIGAVAAKNTAITVVNANTPYNAPAGVTFGTSVTLPGTLLQNEYFGIWLKRVPNTYSTYASTSTADVPVRLSVSATYT